MLSSNAVKTAAKLSWCFEGTDETDGFKMVLLALLSGAFFFHQATRRVKVC